MSRPSSISIVVTPVSVSPVAIAHWMGAAPRSFGQERGVDVHGAARGDVDDAAGQDLAEGDDDLELRREPAERLLRLGLAHAAGLEDGDAAPLGHRLRSAGERGPGPRPFSRSGWVTRAATSWPASRSASKQGMAKLPLPRKTMRTGYSSQPSRARLRSLRFIRSRLRGDRRSTKRSPSMWSISWQKARARSSVAV